MLIKLAWGSLLHRRLAVVLAILSVTVSLMVLLAVEQVREQTRSGFQQSASGVDLIIGSRTGPVNLLLYSVFRLGSPTDNMSWQSYQKIAEHPQVAWAIPVSLGDSHRGYRVLGTTEDYFTHFRYGNKQSLSFVTGERFEDLYDVVLGHDVARRLDYTVGDSLVLSHGISQHSPHQHGNSPFTVAGILAPTGTPVDQTLHVSLAAIEAIHTGWETGVPLASAQAVDIHKDDLIPTAITSVWVGMQSRFAIFQFQREINTARDEPLIAIMPGVVLAQLWQVLSSVENALLVVGAMVLISSLLGIVIMLLSTLSERQRELSLLRIVGAGPGFMFLLIEMEVLVIVATGALTALLSLWLVSPFIQQLLAQYFSVVIEINLLTPLTAYILTGAVAVALLLGVIPAWRAYRASIHAGVSG